MTEKGKFMSNLHLLMDKFEESLCEITDIDLLDDFYTFCQNYGTKHDAPKQESEVNK